MMNNSFFFHKTLALLSLLILSGCVGLGENNILSKLLQGSSSVSNLSAQTAATAAPPMTPAALPNANFVVSVVENVGSSVVKIESIQAPSRTLRGRRQPWEDDSNPERPEKGTGSGFIFRADGYVMTNAHVVSDSERVRVILKDGRRFEGTVIGRDRVTDIAVVKIDANNLPIAKLGNSKQLRVGEWAIAIGNPLGLDNTVTTGIISATGRSSADIGVADFQMELIQTDAAINPGNSGGPLLNAQGQVIGINTAIIRNAQGIGFAIPVHRAQQIATQLIAKGSFTHPYLGIEMITLTEDIRRDINSSDEGLNIDANQGILIVRVQPNSPAALANLRPGDVIQRVNNQLILKSQEIQRIVSSQTVGSEINLGVERRGITLNLPIRIGALPQEQIRR
jgi:S1-C subfamily serine protease